MVYVIGLIFLWFVFFKGFLKKSKMLLLMILKIDCVLIYFIKVNG